MKKINRKAAYELNTEELNYYTKQIEKNLEKRKHRITIKRENLIYLTDGFGSKLGYILYFQCLN